MIIAKIHFFGEGHDYRVDIGYQEVYERLVRRGVDEEEAIEADSWTEVGEVGEMFTGEGYSVTIEEV